MNCLQSVRSGRGTGYGAESSLGQLVLQQKTQTISTKASALIKVELTY